MTVQTQTPARNASRLILALAAIAGLILATFYVVSPVRGTHVAPTLHQGNPDCGSLGTEYDHEFRINEPAGVDGTYDDPNSDFSVDLDFKNTADGQTVDFDANLPVDAVFVKGGPGGNLYIYDPAETSDTGLHAPGNDQGTAVNTPPWSGISHISFCFNDVPATPSPTPTPEGSEAGGTGTPTPTPEGSQAGGTGTPAPSVPNTALSLSGSGSLATIFFGAVLIASLGALAYANVTAVRRRR